MLTNLGFKSYKQFFSLHFSNLTLTLSTVVFLAAAVFGVVISLLAIVKKNRIKFKDGLFIAYICYFVLDLFLYLSLFKKGDLKNFELTAVYFSSVVKFVALIALYAGFCLINRRLERVEIYKKSEALSVKNGQIFPALKLCEEKLLAAACGENVPKIQMDVNVSYLISVIERLGKKDISCDEREWLSDLLIKVRQAYCLDGDGIKQLNKNLELLIKKAVYYGLKL